MPTLKSTTAAAQVLRGRRDIVTPNDVLTVDECLAAGRVLLAERDQLIVIALWARRLLDAQDDDAVARARRRLTAALDAW